MPPHCHYFASFAGFLSLRHHISAVSPLRFISRHFASLRFRFHFRLNIFAIYATFQHRHYSPPASRFATLRFSVSLPRFHAPSCRHFATCRRRRRRHAIIRHAAATGRFHCAAILPLLPFITAAAFIFAISFTCFARHAFHFAGFHIISFRRQPPPFSPLPLSFAITTPPLSLSPAIDYFHLPMLAATVLPQFISPSPLPVSAADYFHCRRHIIAIILPDTASQAISPVSPRHMPDAISPLSRRCRHYAFHFSAHIAVSPFVIAIFAIHSPAAIFSCRYLSPHAIASIAVIGLFASPFAAFSLLMPPPIAERHA